MFVVVCLLLLANAFVVVCCPCLMCVAARWCSLCVVVFVVGDGCSLFADRRQCL